MTTTEKAPHVSPNRFTAESLMEDVRSLTELGWKRNGSPGAAKAAGLMHSIFESHGLETVTETWPYNPYYPQEWDVRIQGSQRSMNSLPIWYSTPGSAVGQALYVDARDGTAEVEPEAFRGKVVLADVTFLGNFLPTDWSTTAEGGLYAAAVAGGAVAYVRRSGAPLNAPMLLHLAQNFPTHLEPARYGAIPAFTVGGSDFDELAEAASNGQVIIEVSNTLTEVPKGGEIVVRDGSLGPGEHLLRGSVDDVLGVLPGMSDEVIVIASHYDTTFDGAVDNATGNAVMLALLRHYAAMPQAARPKTLVFLASGAHDTGDFDLYHFAQTHAEDLLPRVVAFNWLDHMAADDAHSPAGAPVQHGLIATENEVLRAQIDTTMAEFGVPTAPALPPLSSISHLPAHVPAYNITLAPAWYHSIHDTIETVPAQELVNMAHAQLRLVEEIMRTDGETLRAGNPAVELLEKAHA